MTQPGSATAEPGDNSQNSILLGGTVLQLLCGQQWHLMKGGGCQHPWLNRPTWGMHMAYKIGVVHMWHVDRHNDAWTDAPSCIKQAMRSGWCSD